MGAPLSMSTKIGNVMGVPLPFPVRAQLQTRSAMNSSITETELEGAFDFSRSTDNVKYLQNKTGWVRLVSSVDIGGDSLRYFQNLLPDGENLKNASDLAKRFVLFSGTSIYQKTGDSFQYNFREGVSNDGLGAYGNLASKDEVSKYGYRPMPGIVDVKVTTQGRLGSIRQATINFKVWTKDQLDIMDALYFKMGYMMFLEWGHVYYYDNFGKLQQMGVTIDPFEPGLTKESVNLKIADLKEKTDGNYDAMLGMCTSFNFDFNQDGGYDCTIKLIGLGALADSTKVNLSSTIPDFTKEQIEQFYNLYRKAKEIELRKQQAEEAARNPKPPAPAVPVKKSVQEYITSNKPEVTAANVQDYAIPALNQKESDLPTKGSVVLIGGVENTIVNRDLAILMPTKQDDLYDKFTINKDVIKQYTTNAKKFPFVNEKNDIISNGGGSYIAYNNIGSLRIRHNDQGSSDTKVTVDFFTVLQSTTNARYYPFAISFELARDKDGNKENLIYLSDGSSAGSNTISYKQIETYSSKKRSRTGSVTNKIENDDLAWYETLITSICEYIESSQLESNTLLATIDNQDYENLTEVGGTSYQRTKTLDWNKILSTIKSKKGNTYTIKRNINVPIKAYLPKKETLSGGAVKYSDSVNEWRSVDISSVRFTFGPDCSLIKEVTVEENANRGLLFKEFKDTVTDKANAAEAAAAAAEAQKEREEEEKQFQATLNEAVKEEAVNYNSGLETFLRAIQLHSLNKAVTSIGGGSANSPNFDFKEVGTVNLLEGAQNNSIIEQLFANTIFKGLPRKFAENPDQFSKGLEITANKRDRFLAFTSYGYNYNLMSCSDPAAYVKQKALKTCDFKEMFRSWVIPYDMNTQILKDVDINHPVFIRFDLLLLVLNQMCLLYDTPKSDDKDGETKPPALENQTPLIYIDFNTYTNTCLSTPLQMSIDVAKFLIQFRATNEQYRRLFVVETVDESDADKVEIDKLKQQGKSDNEIREIIGKSIKESENKNVGEGLDLFKPEQGDFISRALPEFKDPTNASTGAWQGRIMNVLINIEYLLNLCKNQSNNDNSHGIYLRPFLQQILDDLNKSLGDINMFRLAYDDRSNCLHIVDDQSSPHQPGEEYSRAYNIAMESYQHINLNRNSIELPLYGRDSIAKSLSIKTEVSSKLSNMLAISANSNKKTDAGKDATPFGQYNKDYVNRYMNQSLTVDTGDSKVTPGEKKAAETFNEFVKSIFQTDQPQLDNIDQAINYYVERMNNKKAERSATRASAMIPVSINFTTDGISGLAMGHAFCVPKELLPRTYERFTEATGKRVGFVVVGLDHSIGTNIWETSVRANMFFIKDAQDYYTSSKLFKMNDLAQGSVEGRKSVGSVGYVPEDVGRIDTTPYTPGTAGSGGSPTAMVSAMQAVFRRGGASGLCAYYTYSIANSYVKALRGESSLPGLVHAGGNANDSSYRNRLVALGYKMQNLGTLTKSQLITELNKSRAIGDIINYASLKPVSNERKSNYAYIYGHTQIYHGENAYNVSMQSGKGAKSGWASSWSNNYGAAFVYGSKASDTWEAFLFTLS